MAWFLRTLVLSLAALAGIATSQLPEFAQQYRQRLGGAVDELARVVAVFDADAASQGVDRQTAIAELSANPGAIARDRARAITDDIVRLDRLTAQQQAFRDAGAGKRLVVLAENFDPELAARALDDFEPAVPATLEGVVAGGVGAVAVGCIAFGLGRLLRRKRPAEALRRA